MDIIEKRKRWLAYNGNAIVIITLALALFAVVYYAAAGSPSATIRGKVVEVDGETYIVKKAYIKTNLGEDIQEGDYINVELRSWKGRFYSRRNLEDNTIIGLSKWSEMPNNLKPENNENMVDEK